LPFLFVLQGCEQEKESPEILQAVKYLTLSKTGNEVTPENWTG